MLDVSLFYYLYKNQIFQVGVFSDDDHLMPDDSNVSADLRQANVNIGDSRAFGLTTDLNMNIGDNWLLGWNMLLIQSILWPKISSHDMFCMLSLIS